MKYRIKNVFSLNADTGKPETNYMLQKRVFGRWEGVRQYVNRFEAESEKKRREESQ